MGCTNILANALCFECKEKEWINEKKEYFCRRFSLKLDRVDGNSGGAVRNLQCISNNWRRSGKKT